jgi:hypothetical protein
MSDPLLDAELEARTLMAAAAQLESVEAELARVKAENARLQGIEQAARVLVDYGIGAAGTRSMPTSPEMVMGLFADLRSALSSPAEEPGKVHLKERSEDGRRGYLQGYRDGVEAAIRAVESTEEYGFSVAVKMAPSDHLACAVARIRTLSPADPEVTP